MDQKELVAAVEREGLKGEAATHAVKAVFAAIRKAETATLVFREVSARSAKPEARRTIFLCG